VSAVLRRAHRCSAFLTASVSKARLARQATPVSGTAQFGHFACQGQPRGSLLPSVNWTRDPVWALAPASFLRQARLPRCGRIVAHPVDRFHSEQTPAPTHQGRGKPATHIGSIKPERKHDETLTHHAGCPSWRRYGRTVLRSTQPRHGGGGQGGMSGMGPGGGQGHRECASPSTRTTPAAGR
jgi:hypothetical protein